MEIRMEAGGCLKLEILSGGGVWQFWKSGRKEGSKKCAFCRVCVDFSLNNPFAYFLNYSQVFASKLPITPTFQGNKKSLRYRESTLYIIYDNKFVIFY